MIAALQPPWNRDGVEQGNQEPRVLRKDGPNILGEIIRITVVPADKDRIRDAAAKTGLSVAAFTRQAAIRAAKVINDET